MYADIIVDISHESLDRTFTYRIPASMESVIDVGDYVSIPFGSGNRMINGYVMGLKEHAGYDENKIKDIASIITDSTLTESKLIKLASWMKKQYGSTMIQAMKTVLPIRKTTKQKTEKWIVLNVDEDKARQLCDEYERKHRTARLRLLTALCDNPRISSKLVTSKLNITSSTIKVMSDAGIIRIEEERIFRNTADGSVSDEYTELNDDQRRITDSIINDYDEGIRNTYLIHGITGSGKTEIYMEIIDHVVKSGKQVIVLIPEISLTYQTVMRFYKRFGDRVSTLHSRLSDGEKYDQFERAKKGDIDVMIGPRSALFTPFEKLGLIVIDEEHEPSYKSDSMPKYHAREVAEKLSELHGASLILGSATPALDSYYKAVNGNYKLFSLLKRAKEASLPTVHISDLREELKAGNRTMFSRELKELMDDRLEKGEQIMLFLNRRGYAGFISCRECGHVMKCPHCEVSLSRHNNGKLVCHYCGYEQSDVSNCPSCGSKYILGMRAGTESVEQKVKKMFPQANVLRMDADTTKKKDDYERILGSFANREADILIGTQMIVKGHDFPYVTLVGILAADMSLYANDYRAGERTFNLLTQAAGRAGRDSIKGDVVIQTYSPEHYCIQNAASQDYVSFYNEEIACRDLLGYPPCAHMLLVLVESKDEELVKAHSEHLAEYVNHDIINRYGNTEVNVIGPAEASVSKINDIFRRVVYYKSEDMAKLTQIKDLVELYESNVGDKRIRVTFDFDPLYGY